MKVNDNAVSEVVSTLLTLVVVLGVVTAVLLWGLIYMGEREILSESQTVFGGFDIMYDTMRGLIIDGYGAKGSSNIISTNEKASLTIDSQGKKLILMYTFIDKFVDNGADADFNVSGLDDEDTSFSIEAVDPAFTLDKVQIYWLDPEKMTQQFPLETSSYERIYQNHWCAQSFIPPQNNWELGKIKIYVMKRGVVTSDLNVSIYNSTGGHPDINKPPWVTYVIHAEDVPSSLDWVECDFNIQLPLNTYYIGINTSGGSFGNGSYNYYKWSIDINSPYIFGAASTTDNDGLSWSTLPGYDFGYRLRFTDNIPPSTSEFVIPNSPIYSAINEPFGVKATDLDGDDVSYRIFWGDDNISGWSGEQQSGVWQNMDHTYAKPGGYTLTIQAKDTNGNIYEPDNVTKIYVQTGDYLPEDSYYNEPATISGSNPIWTITTQNNRPLNGTLRIDLFTSYDQYPFSGGSLPFGRIYVFDLGSITHESPHDMGTQRTIFENGGVLTSGPISNDVLSPPSFFEEDNATGFRIIQIGKSYATGGSGRGIYKIGLSMKNNYNREPRFWPIYNFKMQMHDSFKEVEQAWINYFINSYDFEKIPDRPDTIYCQGTVDHFVLDSSFIEANVEAVR